MRETLYGRQEVREALRAQRREPYRLVLAEGIISAPVVDEIVALAQERRVSIDYMNRRYMDSLVGDENHQGVALEAAGYPYVSVYDMLDLAKERKEPPLILLLDLVQDVRNLGAILRTLEAVGGHGAVIQGRRAAGITPAAANVSSGAVEHLLVAQVTNLSQTVEQLKAAELWIAGLEDVYGSQPYTEVDLSGPLGIVVGSEGEGLRRLVRERCDYLLSIPMRGEINSLNASVAGSVVLCEVVRQRGLIG
ncbi:MAG: 23S rRNA (guanosine(2251)-2'-O)-methyltransferase RlmB [Anaerolineales bacterium]